MEVLSVRSSATAPTGPELVRDATIIIRGEYSSSELRVNKDLLSSKSVLLKDLFDSANGPVKLEERDGAQLTLFLELIHSPHLQNSLLLLSVWNSSHAKLACKYLLEDFVDRYAALAEVELKRLTPENFLIVENTGSAPQYNNNGFNPEVFMGFYTKLSDVLYVKKSDRDTTISLEKSIWKIKYKGKVVMESSTQILAGGTWTVRCSNGCVFGISLTVKNSSTGARGTPFGPVTHESVLFWDIVDTVMTHDGLRFHLRGMLGDTKDLRALLTSSGGYPFQFWHASEMLKHFTVEDFASLCLEAGGVLKP